MVRFTPMNEKQLQDFLDYMIPLYAKDKVEAGTWRTEEALELSRGAYARLLPDGIATAGEHLYMVVEETSGTEIGFVWLHMDHDAGEAFLYEITLYEDWRGRGLGKATMAAMEQQARELGAKAVGLHVFGHNRRAIGLYEQSGYAVTDISMKKNL